MNLDRLGHVLRPLATRIANSIARGVVKLADDSTKLQLLQIGVLAGETVDHAQHHQSYGFSSVPLPGAEVVVLFPNGDRSHPLVVGASDRRYRPVGGQGGEVCMYTDEGDVIRLGRGHVVTVTTSGQIKLGSAGASEAAIKGTSRNTAEQTYLTALGAFLTALTTYVNGIQPNAEPGALHPITTALDTAISTFAAAASSFATAAGAALSSKVKLE